MKMRAISLVILTTVLATAPAAMAAHCLRCRPDRQICITASNYGSLICDWDPSGWCFTDGSCGDHAAAPTQPLASEFEVASVERLDERTNEPQPKTAAVLIASDERKH